MKKISMVIVVVTAFILLYFTAVAWESRSRPLIYFVSAERFAFTEHLRAGHYDLSWDDLPGRGMVRVYVNNVFKGGAGGCCGRITHPLHLPADASVTIEVKGEISNMQIAIALSEVI